MIIGIIPARLSSQRLHNKPIKILDKVPIIIHVLKRAMMSKKLDKVIVCADDIKIVKVVNSFGFEAFLTSKKFNNGTERIASFLETNIKNLSNIKLVVDIQCDEVFLNSKYLDKVINFHLKNINSFDVVIPHSLTKERLNKNFVKIVSDQNGKVLYLTRADAPFNFRKNFLGFKRHLDFITFKPFFLKKFNILKNRYLENYEGIELMRVIENHGNVGTIKIEEDMFSINTKKDFYKALKIIKKDKIRKCY